MKKLDAKTEARIEEIIRTLTLEQKVGQMNQTVSWAEPSKCTPRGSAAERSVR